jgi:hypothetical protein
VAFWTLGDDVGFVLKNGREIDAPKRALMCFDNEGVAWPKCSVLVASLKLRDTRPLEDDEYNGAPKDWLGRSYDPNVSTVTLPPKSLSQWTEVGELKRIYYHRFGTKLPGPYKHDINKPRGFYRLLWLFKGKMKARLFRLGRERVYRVELDECVLDGRGIVRP